MTLLCKAFAALGVCAPLLAVSAPTATNLDPLFGLTSDPNVYNATTAPHVTVQGVLAGANDVAWYAFTGKAGQRFYADHDDAISAGPLVDSVLSLFDAGGRLLALGDDSDLDAGSYSNGEPVNSNAFLGVYTLPTTGRYYLALSSWGNGADIGTCAPSAVLAQPNIGGIGGTAYDACSINFALLNTGTADGSYALHVSLAAVPEPNSLALAGVALAGLAWRRRRTPAQPI